jgi:phytoene dehydrogenase-like protein
MSKKFIIIGAGIAGLSAGCYLRMNGYDTEIFELHSLPGGLCTSWQRGGYTFNGCLGWLDGSNPAGPGYQFWNELVDMKQLEFVYSDEFIRVEDRNGRFISVRTGLDELEQELMEKAPEDKELIAEWIGVAGVKGFLYDRSMGRARRWGEPGQAVRQESCPDHLRKIQ